jgi:hypothetical protein
LEENGLKLIGSFKTALAVAFKPVFAVAMVAALVASTDAAIAADSSAESAKANDTTTGASSESDSTKGLPTKDSKTGIQPGSPAEKLKGPEDFPPDVVIKKGATGQGKDSAGAAALKDIKKHASKTPDEKVFFKAWFEKFFSAVYYAKTLDDVKPYFASRMTKTWAHMDTARAGHLLSSVKQLRATDTSITTFTKSAAGYYEMTVQGQMLSGGEKGNGATYYRLIKEGNSYKIENFKGKAWARPRYYEP